MKRFTIILSLICSIILPFSINAGAPAEDTIVIDDIRNLSVNDNTSLTIDRRAVATTRGLEQYGTGFLSHTLPGFKANINYTSGANPADGGELNDINLVNSVVGPVTTNNGSVFQVLQLNLVVDADTIIEGANSIEEISVGTIVAASGIEADNGVIRATRLEVMHNGSPYWLITGDVLNLDETGFDIGAQHISTNDVNIQSIVLCSNDTFENGQKVIVDLEPVDNYTVGDAINAFAIICYDDFEPPVDPPNSVFFNGEIESVNENQSQIVVEGTTIVINDETQILSNTGNTQLETGMNVSVNGYEDAETPNVIAEFIFINDDEPKLPPPFPTVFAGVVSNVSATDFSINGLTIVYNAETEYVEGSVADLIDGALVEVIASSEGPGNNPSNPTGLLTALQVTYLIDLPPVNEYISVTGAISNLSENHMQFNLANEIVELSQNTMLIGITIAELADGVEVSVEGQRDSDTQHLLAEFLMPSDPFPTDPPGHVCMSGEIQSVNSDQTQFTFINGGIVNVNAQTTFVEGTQVDLIVGAYVDVSGITSQANNEVDAEVIFFAPINPPAYVFFSGFINAISESGTQLTVGETVVNITEDTSIIGGDIESLVVGIEVQIDGVVNEQSNEVDASSIFLPVAFVSAQGPVLVSDVTISEENNYNGKVSIMGIEVNQNELTFDPSNLFMNGLAEEQAVVFFGYQDDAGVVWASFVYPIESQGTPNNPNGDAMYFVNGDVTNIDDSQLSVMGINIGNLDNVVIFNENREVISLEELLNGLSVGDSINVVDADSYDRDSNTLNAGSIYLTNESQQEPPAPTRAVKATTNDVNGSGIITRVIEDVIFNTSF